MRHRVVKLLFLSCWPGVGVTAHAQAPDRLQQEQQCRNRAQELRQDGKLVRSVGNLISPCGPVAGTIIAEHWALPPGDSIGLRAMVDGSVRLRDNRILQATLMAAGNKDFPRAVRTAALEVVWFFSTRTHVRFGSLRNAGMANDESVVWAVGTGYVTREGEENIPADVGTLVAERLRVFMQHPQEDHYMKVAFRDVIRAIEEVRRQSEK